MIIDENSAQSSIGLAVLGHYLYKLTPLVKIDLKIRGGQQVLVVTGPRDTFVSNSFGWGRADERTKALWQATSDLGWPVPLEVFQQIPPTQERLIQAQPPRSPGLPLPPPLPPGQL